jgi:transposase
MKRGRPTKIKNRYPKMIKNHLRKGKSVKYLSEMFGVSISTVHNWIKKDLVTTLIYEQRRKKNKMAY